MGADVPDGHNPSSTVVQRPEWIGLAVVLCIAAALRLAEAGASLWLDELHTAWTVADGIGSIVPRAVIGNQSPVYFFFVWLATAIFGCNEWSLRLPSLLAGVGLSTGGWWAVRRWTGSGVAGLLTATLVAVDRHCIFYGQEARVYALVQLVGLIQIAVFIRLLEAGGGTDWRSGRYSPAGSPIRPTASLRGAFLATTLSLYYLHYTSLLLLLAELAAFTLLWLVKPWRPAYRWRQWAVDLAILTAGLAPSWPHVLDIAARREAWAMFISKQPVWNVFTLLPLTTSLLLPAGICAAAWLGQRVFAGRMGQGTPRPTMPRVCPPAPRTVVIVLCWLFIPLAAAWCATERDWARLFFLRYIIVSMLAPFVLAGFAAAACPGRWSRWLCAAAVITTAVWGSGMIDQWRFDGRLLGDRNQDWRGAVAVLNDRLTDPQTPVFVRSGLIEADRLPTSDDPRLREFCLLPVRGLYRLRHEGDALIPLPTSHPGQLSAADQRRIHATGEAWFILLSHPDSVEPIAQDLVRSCESDGAHSAHLAERLDFGDVAVLRIQSRSNRPF